MLDTVRKFVREWFGGFAPKSTEDLSRTLVKQGQATKEQAKRIARDVVEWSKKNTEMLADLVQREVRQQITRLGVATKEEVTALRRRLRDLEVRGGRPKRASARPVSAAKAGTAKRTGKKTAAKRTAAKKASAKRTAARRPARKRTASKTSARKTARPARRVRKA
jgi:polyhydroxyalkanoate synthesis regulator phasin